MTTDIAVGSRWIKKHGNVRTLLEVEDASDPQRIRTRVIDDGGSTAESHKTGRTPVYDAGTLTFYYEPVSE